MSKRARAVVLAALACLVVLALAALAAAYVPEGAEKVEEAEDLLPIWIFHGDAEGVDDLEKFVIEDNDVRGYEKGEKEIQMRIGGEEYPSGELDLSKVITYRVLQGAIAQLWPEDVPVREDLEVVCADPSPHTEGIFEYVTRAASRDAYELEVPEGTGPKNLTAENFHYRFTNTDTDEEFETVVLEEVWPEDFFVLRKKVISGKASTSEVALFDQQWEEIRGKFLEAEEPGELFDIPEEEEETPVWPIVFAFGLLGLVTGTTIYSVARGRVGGKY